MTLPLIRNSHIVSGRDVFLSGKKMQRNHLNPSNNGVLSVIDQLMAHDGSVNTILFLTQVKSDY